MTVVWRAVKYLFTFAAITALMFTSGLFSVLLYGKMTGKNWTLLARPEDAGRSQVISKEEGKPRPGTGENGAAPAKRKSMILTAPIIKQRPELPAGCEITSLAMLLQYYGIEKSKMDLVAEMKKDPTPMKKDRNGNIVYWGNPYHGYVGDVTGKKPGFGIYHTALFPLLKKYIPTAENLTNRPFGQLEQKISEGIPVVVWTTMGYTKPKKWISWNTSGGPFKTTFELHAVLLVGYDETHVYVNDPWTGKQKAKVDKRQFVSSWEAMGRQALSYKK